MKQDKKKQDTHFGSVNYGTILRTNSVVTRFVLKRCDKIHSMQNVYYFPLLMSNAYSYLISTF